MEKKEEITLIDAFKDFKEEKNIDRPVMMGVLKDVFLTQIAKTYGSADNFDVIINVDKGDCEIYQNFDVVEEVENPNTQITLDQIKAETGDDDYEIGDVYTKKLSLASFGRRGILNIRQNLQGRIMDIDKANVFKAYSDKIGEIFTGEIYQTWSKEVIILDDDNNELHLPKAEQIPGERFKKGDTLRAIIKSVEMKNNTTPTSLFPEHPTSSLRNSSSMRFRRYSMASSPSRRLSVYLASAPRWLSSPTTRGSTRSERASA